jgi:hypothetical protein
MNKLFSKLAATVIIAALLIYAAPMIMPAVKAQIPPFFEITPGSESYTTSSPPPGNQFTVTVVAGAVNGTDSWSVEVGFDNTQLSVVSATIVSTAAGGLWPGKSTTPLGPLINSNNVEASETLLGADYLNGNQIGNVLNITFQTIATPTVINPTLTSKIDPAFGLPPVSETLFILQSPTPTYPTGEIDNPTCFANTFTYTYTPPALPTMVVENTSSDTFNAYTHWVGTTFTENVVIASLNPAWSLTNASVQWAYNATLLSVTSVTFDPIWGSSSYTNVAGLLTLNGYSMGTIVTKQDVVLASVVFTILTQGSTTTPGTFSASPKQLSNIALTSIYPSQNIFIVNGIPAISNAIVQNYPSPWASTQVTVYDYQVAFPPFLSVSSYTAGPGPALGQDFNVTVTLNNVVEPLFHIFAIQFRLLYDPTLITFVSATEGPFFPAAAAKDPNCLGTWFDAVNYPVDSVNGPNVIVGDMILPNASGYWLEDSLPNGTGVVAILTFQVASQSFGEAPASSPLAIETVTLANQPDDLLYLGFDNMINQNVVDITPPAPINGVYSVSGVYNNAVVFDMYGGAVNDNLITLVGGPYWQFAAPYGGQGPNNPMDLVLPQSQVYLWANLTYNYYPITDKPVTFEVDYPNGGLLIKLTAYTDENGVAGVTFRMPWPDPNGASAFGVYTVSATTSVSDVNYMDTIQYEYNYLLNVWKVTTDMYQYNHLQTVSITINYDSYAMQNYPALFVSEIVDNMSVPVGFSYMFLNPAVGSNSLSMWNVLTYYQPINMPAITIPLWAYAGVATIYTDVVTNWPYFGGVALTPEYVGPTIGIQPY